MVPKIATLLLPEAVGGIINPNSPLWDLLGAPGYVRGKIRLSLNQGMRTKSYYDFVSSQASTEVLVEGEDTTFIYNFLNIDESEGFGMELHGDRLWFKLKKSGEVVGSTYVMYDEVLHANWRCRERFGVLLWETSKDGQNWVVQRQASHGINLSEGKLILANLSGRGFGDGLFGEDLFGSGGRGPQFGLHTYGEGPYGDGIYGDFLYGSDSIYGGGTYGEYSYGGAV